MKKFALSLSIALAAAAGLGVAHAQDMGNGSGGFVAGQVGSSHWNTPAFSANRPQFGVSGGYRWSTSQNQSLGAELGYADFGQPRFGNGVDSASVKAHAWTLGANYNVALSDQFYLQSRAGYLRYHLTGAANLANTAYSASTSGDGWYAGVGVGYSLTPSFGVKVGYDYNRGVKNGTHVNIGVASVGAEYRF